MDGSEARTDIAPAVNMLVEHLDICRDHVSMLLSFGATPYEAACPAYTATFRQAMIPTINGMNVIRLVSIPGMRMAASHLA